MDMFKAGLNRKIQRCAGVLLETGHFNDYMTGLKQKCPLRKMAAKVDKRAVSTYQIKNKCLKLTAFTIGRHKTSA